MQGGRCETAFFAVAAVVGNDFNSARRLELALLDQVARELGIVAANFNPHAMSVDKLWPTSRS